MLISVPILNEDGSVQFTQTLDKDQVQALLGFALNFLTATGLSCHYGLVKDKNQTEMEFND